MIEEKREKKKTHGIQKEKYQYDIDIKKYGFLTNQTIWLFCSY